MSEWVKITDAYPMLHVNEAMETNKAEDEMFLISDPCVCAMDNGDFGIGVYMVEYTEGKLTQGWDIRTYYNGIKSDPIAWANLEYKGEEA